VSNTYTGKDIKVLDEVTHIRTAPGMYIGDTSTPTHLVEECLDNSLDECSAGHATIIAVEMNTKDHIYSVADNGRGIPLDNDVPKMISTKLFSGAKFQGSKTAYEVCSGLHGVGLVAVNALSDFYMINIYRDNKHAIYAFKNQKYKSKKIDPFDGERPFSTKIEFRPDKKIFENLVANVDRIRRRLYIASIELSRCTFVLTVDGKKEIIKLSKKQFFLAQCASEPEKSEVISATVFNKVEKFSVMFSYSLTGAITPKILTSINLLPVEEGGTHVTVFNEILRDLILAKAKKMKLRILPPDCFCGLRAYLSLSLIEPEFSSQTKDKLINRKTYLDVLSTKLRVSIENFFLKNDDLISDIMNHLAEYRAKIDAKKFGAAATNGKRASTKFTKLRDCTSRSGELFIVEGDSAGGGFISCRDPNKHAVLPLKGKIPSVATAKDLSKIMKHNEIGEMIAAFGTGVGPAFDVSKLRYEKIICTTDADADGKHIASILTLNIAILFPDIIKNGHYYIAETPLYAINEKKIFIPLWTEEEVEKAKNEKRTISRFKGLGELNPKQLKKVAIDESTRRLIQVTYTSDLDKMVKLFSLSSEKRKLLEGGW